MGLRRRTPLRRSRVSPASEAQRATVPGKSCLVCGGRPVDPAHVVPRSLGGCDDPTASFPWTGAATGPMTGGELDLLPHLEPHFRAELAHALTHLPLIRLLRRLTGQRWQPVETGR